MAFDGITTAALTRELNEALAGGGISKIIQPEKDELLLTVKSNKVQYRVALSASASLPLVYLTPVNKQAPMTAPNFCMLLRKHLQGGQILRVHQPSLERVIIFDVSHRDELGDLVVRHLIIELMGKYSNIILTDDDDTILDSIKRVPFSVSSVREVLPGKKWFIPGADTKQDPLTVDPVGFGETVLASPYEISKALYMSYTGLSPLMAEAICAEADVEPRKKAADLSVVELDAVRAVFENFMWMIKAGEFAPNIVYENEEPKEYAMFELLIFKGMKSRTFDSVSGMITAFYGEKEEKTRMRQKSADLRHVVSNALDRVNRKAVLQERQMKDTEKREKYRIYGEMLNTYGYGAEEGAKSLEVINYYTNEPLTVPLDPTLSASANAQKYFERYNKLKRTADALKDQIEETRADREQLESCLAAIDMAESEADLAEIRRELTDFGFVQKKAAVTKGKAREARQKPLMFISSDGFTMYVGRNNYQNEEVTFKIGSGGDMWFHAKGMPGSHVIVKSGGRELTDRAYEEAGALAAWYSSGRKAGKVEVDYTERRNLRKTNGGKPGFVIYHTNYSLMAVPSLEGLRKL